MAPQLEIEDGNPWWMSLDLWTVPGNDPLGTPGSPVAGTACYVWARVHNTGKDFVTNATVRYYWANPAVGFDRTTANLIGTAFVSLAAGQTEDVLCLTPWIPVYLNSGHECILAEAFHPSLDPLPASSAFNVPTDRHVAQRNLSVIGTASSQFFHFAFEVHNPQRIARAFTVAVEMGRLEEVREHIKYLQPDLKLPRRDGWVTKVGFVRSLCPHEDELEQAPLVVDNVEVGPGGRTGFSVVGKLDGEAALIHVKQSADKQLIGGLSILILSGKE